MRNKITISATTSFLAAVLALSACGGGAKTTTGTQPPVTTSAAAQTTGTQPPVTTSAAAQTTGSSQSNISTTPIASTQPATGFLVVVTAGTAVPPAGIRVMFQDPNPGKQPATKVPHILDGAFTNCLTCHYSEPAVGSLFAVDVQHPCIECHAVAPSVGFDPSHYCGDTPTQPLQLSCILCHKAA